MKLGCQVTKRVDDDVGPHKPTVSHRQTRTSLFVLWTYGTRVACILLLHDQGAWRDSLEICDRLAEEEVCRTV